MLLLMFKPDEIYLKRKVNCLKQGHSKKDCHTKIKCYKCKSLGSHHTALCEFQSTNGAANFASQETTILLQRANAKIVNNKNYHYVAKVSFHSCSQQMYISQKVAQKLNLMTLQERNVGVKAFDSEKEKEYEICLQLLYDNRDNVTICALALPNICLPVGGQYMNVAIEQNTCLQSLGLADRGDLLIGADFYWKLVNGEKKKIKDVSLFSIKLILGWLLNGPVSKCDAIVANSLNLIQSSHVLKVS